MPIFLYNDLFFKGCISILFTSRVLKEYSYNRARIVQFNTPHGDVLTPVFMPVATRAGVNNMMSEELLKAGSQIILGGNTYHMLCSPGMEVIKSSGGMHPLMGWNGPMLTDSGGFQVFSLSKNKELCTIDEKGAHFKLPGTDVAFHMTPEKSLETQKIIGADIIMAFDQCTPDNCSHDEVNDIMERTHRWLGQSIEYHEKNSQSFYGNPQALFGIIQGGIYEDLRCKSAEFVASMNLAGIAIGGETIGFDMAMTIKVLRWIYSILPQDKPRYTMGVGMSPQDLLDVVKEGVDMFDCVAPTRNARHGALFCGEVVKGGTWLKFKSPYENHRIQIKKACFSNDLNPIMESCQCFTCLNHSRAFLHHLFKQKAPLFSALASIHNIHVMHDVCDKMRHLILTS